jgi:hypothetical protein
VREAAAIEPIRASTAIDLVEGKKRFKRGHKNFYLFLADHMGGFVSAFSSA